MMTPWLYAIPFISALTGWLLHQLYSRYILYTYLPKHKASIIKAISGNAGALFSWEALENKIAKPELLEKSVPMLEKHVDAFLNVKLPQEIPMLAMFVGNKTTDKIKEVFLEQLKQLFPQVMTDILHSSRQNFDLSAAINEALSRQDMTQAFKTAIKKATNKFNSAGLLSGFIIGCVNLLLFLIIR